MRNYIGIGLAAGFIEPLESTGIYLSEFGVRALTECWPTAANRDVMAAEYNRRFAGLYDELLEFIVFHYRLARRRDTAFWYDAAENGRIRSARATVGRNSRRNNGTRRAPKPMAGMFTTS